jgi:hypothetical protein
MSKESEGRALVRKLRIGRCPFCAGLPEISGTDESFWQVACQQCEAMSGLFHSPEEAAAAWNCRPQPWSA